jgi:polysaccharide deacetylase family sporulation protein PdaB
MFVYTFTRKRMVRIVLLVLAVLAGVGIGVWAITSSIDSQAQDRLVPIYHVERGDNKISLTFDCAWGNSNTDRLLEILEKENIKATFFVTGEFCDNYPDDVRKLYAAGHEIQNHSDKHPHVLGMNVNALIEDTRECSRKIKMLTGEVPILYRAPYGEYDNNTITAINGMGLHYIQWNVDSIDWQEPSKDEIIQRVVNNAVSGSILLFHNDLENTTQALPEVIKQLKAKGFTFVKASELIYNDNYIVDHTGKQIFQPPADRNVITYSDNSAVNEIMDIIRRNLTLEEIYRLADGVDAGDVVLIERIYSVLNDQQIAVLESLSYEDLQAAYANLVKAAEEFGAGEDIGQQTPGTTTSDQTGDIGIPVEMDKNLGLDLTTAEETDAPVQTTTAATEDTGAVTTAAIGTPENTGTGNITVAEGLIKGAEVTATVK